METRPETTVKESLDITEKGSSRNGVPQTTSRRLYVQLQAYGNCKDTASLVKALQTSGLESVLYLDVNDPEGVAFLFLTEDPSLFTTQIRQLLTSTPFASLTHKPEFTMLGRTYSSGREADLEDWLLMKSRRNAFNPEWPWAIWYPLKRKPEFELLSKEDQGKILYEHAKIGMAFGQEDFAHDIRLACYGIDKNDNEFVLGLVGSELYPLSRVIQEMRKTQQTGKYMQSMGPFFIGKAIWQSQLKS